MRWSDQQLQEIFEKSDGRCNVCSAGHRMGGYGRYWEVDHRYPVSRGGSDDIENLSVCCVGCNREKSDSVHILDALEYGL